MSIPIHADLRTMYPHDHQHDYTGHMRKDVEALRCWCLVACLLKAA